ncbi:MAG: hypothetical protein ABIJ31_03360 [Pseudomonadota bacterium]
MSAVFFILFTLFLIVMQTVILPTLPFFMQCFDLMIINILFLCLTSIRSSTVFFIVVIGIVMDSLSGVPFGYHLFSYLWIYLLVFVFKQLLFQKSLVFLMVISIVSVVIQHGLLLFCVFINSSGQSIMDFHFDLLLRQIVWGFVFIPPSVWIVDKFYQQWTNLAEKILCQWQKAREN